MNALRMINFVISVIFTVCYSYQLFYILVPFLWKKKNILPTKQNRKYAALICARNEEAVLGDLLESLQKQTYPKEKLRIFVMADNCTDGTAAIAREKGATVYERKNESLIGKGYALRELLLRMEKEHGKFDGYFIFDADNLLKEDYIEQMDKSFCSGYEILTSYRNSKNYGSNWISAGYALWFLRESRYLNQARWQLGTSCAVSGTGFLFSRKVLEECGFWPYHLLTEDIEFSVDQITKGRRIGFCPEAELYDEQPTKFSQSWRQRMRWSRGFLQVFGKYGRNLLSGILHGNFSCFDMTMTIFPAFFLTTVSVFCNAAIGVVGAIRGENPMLAVQSVGEMLLNAYGLLFFIGGLTTVTEWKHIHTAPWKKIGFVFSFPVFMMTYIPIAFCALFIKTGWQPIEHTVSVEKMEKLGMNIKNEKVG